MLFYGERRKERESVVFIARTNDIDVYPTYSKLARIIVPLLFNFFFFFFNIITRSFLFFPFLFLFVFIGATFVDVSKDDRVLLFSFSNVSLEFNLRLSRLSYRTKMSFFFF